MPLLYLYLFSLCIGASAPACSARRASFVIQEITTHNASLAEPLQAEKYAAMGASAPAFFRGTAHLFYSDLGTSPHLKIFGDPSTQIFLQGDANTENFGAFAHTSGAIVYDLLSFDESVIGDYQLDLWRLTTSAVLLARQKGSFNHQDQDVIVDACTGGYLDALSRHVGSDSERAVLFTADVTYGLLDEFLRDAARSNRQTLLDQYTRIDGARKFDVDGVRLAAVPESTARELRDAMPDYLATLPGPLGSVSSYFEVKSVAAPLTDRLESIGATRYYLLIEGESRGDEDDRILELTAQHEPSAFANLDPASRARTESASGSDAAVRVSLATRALGYRDDPHEGVLHAAGLNFSVHERSPYQQTFDTGSLRSMTRMTKLATQWGALLGTAHARSDRDYSAALIPYAFEAQVLGRIGNDASGFKVRVREIAQLTADQVERDYQSFITWLASRAL